MQIGGDVNRAFQGASGLGAEDIQTVLTSVAIVTVLVFSGWYLTRAFARGWHKGDFPHVLTGTILVLLLIFLVFWIAGRDWSPG